MYLIFLKYKFIDGSVTVWVTKGEIIYLHVDGSLKDNVVAGTMHEKWNSLQGSPLTMVNYHV